MAARKRLENRILLLAVIILVVAFGALALVNVLQVTDALESRTMHESRAVAESAAGGIRTLMRSGADEDDIREGLPRFVEEMRETNALEDVHLFDLNVHEPFRKTGKVEDPRVLAAAKDVLGTAADRTVDMRTTRYYLKPVLREPACDECHDTDPPGTKVRGVVAVSISKEEGRALVQSNAVFLSASALATIILVIIGVKLVTRRVVTAPLKYLTQVSDDISKGNLDAEVKVDSADEVGLLAESIERLRVSMKLAMDRLAKKRSSAPTQGPTSGS